MSVCALDCEQGRPEVLGVTQSLHTLFHAPAGLYAPVIYSDVMCHTHVHFSVVPI
jgi:hypothetical protein